MISLKKLIFNILTLLIWMAFPEGGEAQPSNHFNYQAIVNDADGQPFKGNVGVKISILQPSEDGQVVYSERHTVETDEKGFMSFRVGEGDEVYKGDFGKIDWAAGPSFIQTEIAIGGGYLYTLSTTAELVSVPVSLFALTADSIAAGFTETDPLFSESPAAWITEEDTLRWNDLSKNAIHRIGDRFGGGVIFHVDPDGEHGLIASLSEIAKEASWGSTGLATSARSSFDGKANSAQILAAQGPGDFAVNYCDTLSAGGYHDWYLPSLDELYLFFRARYILNKSLEEDGDGDTTGIGDAPYWSSTEKNEDAVFMIESGHVSQYSKNAKGAVRAIRVF